MPRFFFHTQDGTVYHDEEGTELLDVQPACATALQVLAEHIQAWPGDFWKHDALQVHMVDDDGLHLLTLTIGATFAPALLNRTQTARPDGHERLDSRPRPKELPED